MQIYLQYQLAADRLENAIRDLAGARAQHGPASKAFEAAQAEYDKVCELAKLVAPVTTVQAAMRQRRLFNRLAVEALDGTYDHDVNYPAIAEMAAPVLWRCARISDPPTSKGVRGIGPTRRRDALMA